jgi:hypothetical protein
LTLAANTFHVLKQQGPITPSWKHTIKQLENELSSAINPKGVAEQPLLDFFGATIENTALLVFGLHGVVPTHVAREFRLNEFRSDFAWIALDEHAKPMVGFIELEPALEDTLFSEYTYTNHAKKASTFAPLSYNKDTTRTYSASLLRFAARQFQCRRRMRRRLLVVQR